MCSGIVFLVGLFLLLKGDFRISNRDVPKERGRLIGLLLLAPLGFTIIYTLFISSRMQTTYSNLEEMLSDPAIMNAACIELILLGAAVASAAYLVLALPPSEATRTPRAHGVPAAPPNVMTTEEAAAYLRIPEFEVIALIEEGKLPAARIGGDYRIARIAVDEFLRSQGGGPVL